MMLDKDWTPIKIKGIEEKWASVFLPVNENISHSEAERLMITYLAIREDWLDAFVNAQYYHDMCDIEMDNSYNLAFSRADAKSDKQRDIVARQDLSYNLRKTKLAEAKAVVLQCKMNVEGAGLAHHAVKEIYRKAADEVKYL